MRHTSLHLNVYFEIRRRIIREISHKCDNNFLVRILRIVTQLNAILATSEQHVSTTVFTAEMHVTNYARSKLSSVIIKGIYPLFFVTKIR